MPSTALALPISLAGATGVRHETKPPPPEREARGTRLFTFNSCLHSAYVQARFTAETWWRAYPALPLSHEPETARKHQGRAPKSVRLYTGQKTESREEVSYAHHGETEQQVVKKRQTWTRCVPAPTVVHPATNGFVGRIPDMPERTPPSLCRVDRAGGVSKSSYSEAFLDVEIPEEPSEIRVVRPVFKTE